LSDHGRDWKPLIYCWRGGQRSGSLALVMREIGWDVTLLEGGYKTYRRYVQQVLDQMAPRLRFIVVAGPTGCGKTDLLHQLQSQGRQVLDLESLANHRGSLLGREPGVCQPSQKWFESSLYFELCQFDLGKPIYVESESSKIGEIHLPTALFKNLITSSAIVLSCDRSQRAQYLVQRYRHLTQSSEDTTKLVERLAFRHGKQQIEEWVAYITNHNWLALATSLLEHHYDPAYARSQTRLRVTEHCELLCPGKLGDDSVFERIDA
jgi:tRNA 2-selenouridine synthase